MTRNPEKPVRSPTFPAAIVASALVLTPVFATPGQACIFSCGGGGGIVYDPSNHAENILSAARALAQINNQITQLQNEALNLASLPYSTLEHLQEAISETQRLLAEADSIAFDVTAIEAAFAEDYGVAATRGDFEAMIGGARSRWETSVAGFEDALRVQAGVVGNIESARRQMDGIVRASQGAAGALQATQAGNQLLALQSAQIADLTAAITASSRADALEAARIASAEAQGRENLTRFLDYGEDYSASSARLFRK